MLVPDPGGEYASEPLNTRVRFIKHTVGALLGLTGTTS